MSPVATNRLASLPGSSEPMPAGHAEDLGRRERDGAQRGVRGQAEGARHGRLVGQVARLRGVVGDDGEAHARRVQRGRRWRRRRRRDRTRGAAGGPRSAAPPRPAALSSVGAAPGLEAAGDDQLQPALARRRRTAPRMSSSASARITIGTSPRATGASASSGRSALGRRAPGARRQRRAVRLGLLEQVARAAAAPSPGSSSSPSAAPRTSSAPARRRGARCRTAAGRVG